MSTLQRRRWLVNLALLAAVTLLSAMLLFERGEAPSDEASMARVIPQDVERFRILRPDKKPLEFDKHNGVWRMTAPYQQRADENTLQRALAMPEWRVHSRVQPAGLELADFGLSPPQARLLFNETEVLIGDMQPVNQLRYVMAGGTIYLIAAHHMAWLNAGGVSYIDRHLVPQGAAIERVTLDGQALEPQSSEAKQWQTIKANWVSHADRDATDPLVGQIQITLADQTITYTALQRDTGIALRKGELEYHITPSVAAALGLATTDATSAE